MTPVAAGGAGVEAGAAVVAGGAGVAAEAVVSYHRITVFDWVRRNRNVSRSPSASRMARRVTIVTTSPARSSRVMSARSIDIDPVGLSDATNTKWFETKAICPRTDPNGTAS